MKKTLISLMLLLCPLAHADSVNDAYKDGANTGKSSSGQGTGALTGSDPSTFIPGYTANPPQSGYYGGVQGGDGGIGDKGLSEFTNGDAGKTVTDSASKNPPVTLDPNADYIQTGKNAEGNAGSMVDGTSAQCTEKVVSKTTFQDYTCSADMSVSKTCTRNTQITGSYVEQTTRQVIDITAGEFTFSMGDDRINYSFPVPAGATLLSGSLTVTVGEHGTTYTSTLHYPNSSVSTSPRNSFSVTLGIANTTAPSDGRLKGYWTNQYSDYLPLLLGEVSYQNGVVMTAQVTVLTTKKVWQGSTTTPQYCDDNTGGKLVSSKCSVPGGDKTVVVDGKTQTVHSDCWQYTDTYLLSEVSNGTCAELISNANCTRTAATCTETTEGKCSHSQYTYQCQKTWTSGGLLCGDDYFCKTGDCDGTNGAGDSGFDLAVAKLAGLASAGEDVKNGDQVNIKAFTGQSMACRKAMAGFSNCCVDSGWGNSAGLANCSSEEMAIGKAKAKKVTVLVGEACAKKALGVCIQKKQVYCVFGGKLARIIQEQGRRDQLRVNFGSGDSPNCRGITVPELQGINFDKINFSDFYSDLMDNQKIPDVDAMTKIAKDRIAAQVNQQTGGSK